MNGITDLLITVAAFLSMLLDSGSDVFFWKSCFLFALAGLIVKIFSQQMHFRMGSFYKK
jgi:hypothetical protein